MYTANRATLNTFSFFYDFQYRNALARPDAARDDAALLPKLRPYARLAARCGLLLRNRLFFPTLDVFLHGVLRSLRAGVRIRKRSGILIEACRIAASNRSCALAQGNLSDCAQNRQRAYFPHML